MLQGCELTAAAHTGRQGSEQHAALDERAGLATVHVLDGADRQLLSHCGQIDRLAARHAPGAGGADEDAQHLEAHFGAHAVHGLVREHRKAECLQRIAHQDRGRFIVGAMTGWSAAPHIVIVHRGQVIVHEAVDVDQFNGGRGRVESRERRAE